MSDYELFITAHTEDSDTNTNTNNESRHFDVVGTVEIPNLTVDFEIASVNENATIENINSIIANDTNSLLSALSNVQSFGQYCTYQTNSGTNLNSNQNIFSQLSLDPLEQSIQVQTEPFKLSTINYVTSTTTTAASTMVPAWKSYSASNFGDLLQLESNSNIQVSQNTNMNTSSNYFCQANNFTQGYLMICHYF